MVKPATHEIEGKIYYEHSERPLFQLDSKVHFRFRGDIQGKRIYKTGTKLPVSAKIGIALTGIGVLLLIGVRVQCLYDRKGYFFHKKLKVIPLLPVPPKSYYR